MNVEFSVYVLGKLIKHWTGSDGKEYFSYTVNIAQNDGEIIDTLRLSKEQYEMIEVKRPYLVNATYGVGKNGGYLRLISIQPEK